MARELPVPLAADLLGARVVVLAGVAKLFLVIRARLAGAQRLRDGEHGGASYLKNGSGHEPGGA